MDVFLGYYCMATEQIPTKRGLQWMVRSDCEELAVKEGVVLS